MSSKPTSAAKLAVATAEILDAIHFSEHRRIIKISATYKLLDGEYEKTKVPDIQITMEKPSEETT